MSVLALPRFVFQGTTSWNPNTVNNGSVTYLEDVPAPHFYPEGFPPPPPPPVDPSTYDTWLKTYNPKITDPNSSNPPGSWNVYGDQGCNFVNATVTGVQLASGTDGNDPLLGKTVQMVGQSYFPSSTPPPSRMVDVDPYSPYTTQLFYHLITLGDTTVGVSGPGVLRMFSRWPNMSRNLDPRSFIASNMGVTWQASVAAGDLTWYGVDQSPALAALQAAIAQGGQGLVLQFSSYATHYYTQATWQGQPITTAQELSAAYLAGFTGGNPAVSAALGTIGVWGPGELASAPTQRVLVPQAGLSPSTTKVGTAAKTRAAQEAAAAPEAQTAQPVQLGTAFAQVDTAGNTLTLDFLGTFPEQNLQDLTKARFDTFEVQAVPGTGKPVTIGTLTYEQYAKAAYEQGGGMVEISFDSNQQDLVTTGLLQLVQTGSNAVALQESALLAEVDQRCVYVDEGQTQQVTIQVYQQGVTPPAGSVEVLLANYVNGGGVPTDPIDPDSDIVQPTAVELLDAQGNPLPYPYTLQVGPDGSATFGVRSVQPGIGWIFFFPYPAGTTPPTPPSGLQNAAQIPDSYVAVRALAFDNDLLNVPDSQITWDYVYTEVLQTYNLVYPLMSLVLNLGDETTVNQNAKKIEFATSLQQFLTTLFMPITREMSAGKRSVLQRYLQQQQTTGA